MVNIATKLAQSGIYSDDEVRKAAEVWLHKLGNNALTAAMSPAKHAFETHWKAALDQSDKTSA